MVANANNDPVKDIITLSVSIDLPKDIDFQLPPTYLSFDPTDIGFPTIREEIISDLKINWGDGSITEGITHRYSKRGDYTITITGTGIYSFLYRNNNFTAIDVRKCPNLELLDCTNNALTTGLGLTNCPHLKGLRCDGCPISLLDLSRCPKLEYLYCDYSGIERIIFGNSIASLINVRCNNNKLTSLDLSEAKLLRGLSCSSNQLKELRLGENNSLRWLYCNGNQLKELRFGAYNSLEELSCSNNQIETLQLGINIAQSMFMKISCDDNNIENLEISSERYVSLDCSNNRIKNLDLRQCQVIPRINAPYNQLENLYIDNNCIMEFVNFSCNGLDAAALNRIYEVLPTKSQWVTNCQIFIVGNNSTGDKSIAVAKGWKVIDS